jgi:hypothetical protein
MNIFFDIDMTLINPLDRQLRPYAAWAIKELTKAGNTIFLWSHRGEENCTDVAQKVGVPQIRCFMKPPFDNLKRVAHIPHTVDFCVDDDMNSVLKEWPGILVLPYSASYTAKDDKELVRVVNNLVPIELEKKRHPKP